MRLPNPRLRKVRPKVVSPQVKNQKKESTKLDSVESADSKQSVATFPTNGLDPVYSKNSPSTMIPKSSKPKLVFKTMDELILRDQSRLPLRK